jgi:hypothetical protein
MDLAKIEAELDEKDSYPLHRHVTGLSAKSSSIIFRSYRACIPIRMQCPKFVIRPFNIECRLFRLDTIINV